MLDTLLKSRSPDALADPHLFAALEQAAGAFGRLDQALDHHPLRPAFLYRARLDAVRRQAAVDGQSIDPWHLAAVLEGLRLRMDGALRIVDRGAIFDAARTALGHHQWLTAPDFDQEGEVQAAERHLAASSRPSALLGAAAQTHAWLRANGSRPPIRAALVRFWVRQRLLRLPVPLTGPRALAAEAPAEPAAWVRAFLESLAAEARDYHQLLWQLERGWLSARAKATGRRSTSRATAAIDVLAASPLLSATTLARALGMSIKCATELLDQFLAQEIVVEVTHRSARRLFGLDGMAPVRDATIAPRRPEPGRGRGRPPLSSAAEIVAAPSASPRPVARFERPPSDYAALEAAMAHCEQVIRSTKRRLDQLRSGDRPLARAEGRSTEQTEGPSSGASIACPG
jgi:hypothetical protein